MKKVSPRILSDRIPESDDRAKDVFETTQRRVTDDPLDADEEKEGIDASREKISIDDSREIPGDERIEHTGVNMGITANAYRFMKACRHSVSGYSSTYVWGNSFRSFVISALGGAVLSGLIDLVMHSCSRGGYG